jgi:tetratricopeptide (TPR) repeat protein
LQIATASGSILKMSTHLRILVVVLAASVSVSGPKAFAAPASEEPLLHLVATGRSLVLQKRYDQAIQTFTEALAMKRNDRLAAEIHGELGGVWVEKGALDKAMAEGEAAVRLAPNYFRGYQVRGRVYRHRKQFSSALAEFDRAMQLAPNFAQLYNNRGNVFSDQGQERRAIQDFTEAIRRAPRTLDGYVNRGGSYIQIKEFDRALADLNQAIRLVPSDSDSYNNRGLAHMGKGDYRRALADFRRAAELSPRDPAILDSMAEAYAELGDFDAAIRQLNKALTMKMARSNRTRVERRLARYREHKHFRNVEWTQDESRR